MPAEAGDEVLVCDLSMQRNHAALLRLLQAGVQVRYVDHHKVDQVPQHPGLQACIDFDPRVCTSLLMDRLLQGRFRAWALVGAYGDNLTRVADALAADIGLGAAERQQLRLLGEGINYNAYGDEAGDQHIAPQQLYAAAVAPCRSAAAAARRRHRQRARCPAPGRPAAGAVAADPCRRRRCPLDAAARCRLEPARHRHPGQRAGSRPRRQQAHAVLKADRRGGFVVSLRAPQDAPTGADEFCRRFGGGGRAGAAGIDHLPAEALERFHRRVVGGALGWLRLRCRQSLTQRPSARWC